MSSSINKFYIFNIAGRLLGVFLDLVLVYLAAELYAKSYYLYSAIPVLIFSLLAYTSTISNVSSWAKNLMSKLNITIIIVACYCYVSFHAALVSSLNSDLNYIIIITIIAFFAGIVTNRNSASNDRTVWLFPAAGFLSLGIGLFGALTLENVVNGPFYVVFLMTLITPLVFLCSGKKTTETIEVSEIKILALIAVLFCGLRHLVLILYRFYVSDDSIVEYSFNSRIIQNIYAFSLIPLIVYFSKSNINIIAVRNKLLLTMVVAISFSALLIMYLPAFEFFKIHLTWLISMLILGVAIFCSDFYLVTMGHKNSLRSILSQIVISVTIFVFNFSYWGLNY